MYGEQVCCLCLLIIIIMIIVNIIIIIIILTIHVYMRTTYIEKVLMLDHNSSLNTFVRIQTVQIHI
jgi:hypothetical protein